MVCWSAAIKWLMCLLAVVRFIQRRCCIRSHTIALETLRDAELRELREEGPSPQTMAEDERQTAADQNIVRNPTHRTQPGTDSSATDNNYSISASGKIPEHVANSEEQIQAVQPQVRA
jgi:hypothetical protein